MNERGSTLFLTSMLLLSGMIVLTGLFALASADYRAALASVQSTQVQYVAEAGIFRGIARLDEDQTWREGFQSVTFGAGTYTVKVETKDTDQEANQGKEEESKKVPRFVVIRSEAHIPPHANGVVQVVYDVKNKKIVNWDE